MEGVARLDTILARARYAVQHNCRVAEHAPGAVMLREARHPLLGGPVVPVSISTGGENRILIITGPNTGGKTVSLKTVGLLALMNQFGMEIPAGEGSALEIFDTVRADIGDEQSIEQSLSTFSGHVRNLAAIAAAVTSRSLVLLDELGAGTDPEEGVALAMALLDHFLGTGCIVLATTHHGILKNYGATRQGVQNASMGFDRETLAPTYRILMGVPGESHALEIARRTGMPPSILQNAAAYLNDERTDISQLVANLSERHQKLAEAEEEQKARETVLREKWRKTDLKELTLRQKELELRRHGLQGPARLPGIRPPGVGRAAGKARHRSRGGTGVRQARLRHPGKDREGAGQGRDATRSRSCRRAISRSARAWRCSSAARAAGAGCCAGTRAGRWLVETETLRLALLPGELAPAPAGPPSGRPAPR